MTRENVYIRAWGRKNGGPENLLFLCVQYFNPGTIQTMKRTARENGYTITRAVKIGGLSNGFRDIDITDKFR